jgi:hypothetical protein
MMAMVAKGIFNDGALFGWMINFAIDQGWCLLDATDASRGLAKSSIYALFMASVLS